MAKSSDNYIYLDLPPKTPGRVAGVFIVIFLLISIVSLIFDFSTGKLKIPPAERTWSAVSSGDTARYMINALDKTTLVTTLASGTRGAAWLLIGSLGDQVKQGCPDWLFLSEEFQIHADAKKNMRLRMDAIRNIRSQLEDQNIQLVVAMVPDKSRVMRHQLCHVSRSGLLDNRLESWTDALLDDGFTVVNLGPVFSALIKQPGDVFLHTDTHWTEYGAEIAAREIARAVKSLGVEASPKRNYALSPGELSDSYGDLVRLAGIDWLPVWAKPAPDHVQPVIFTEDYLDSAADEDSIDALLGDAKTPNSVLLGSSFSGASQFLQYLEHSLGAIVPSFAKDGGGFWESAKTYFSDPAFSKNKPDLIIWEIPERVLEKDISDEEKSWLMGYLPGAQQ